MQRTLPTVTVGQEKIPKLCEGDQQHEVSLSNLDIGDNEEPLPDREVYQIVQALVHDSGNTSPVIWVVAQDNETVERSGASYIVLANRAIVQAIRQWNQGCDREDCIGSVVVREVVCSGEPDVASVIYDALLEYGIPDPRDTERIDGDYIYRRLLLEYVKASQCSCSELAKLLHIPQEMIVTSLAYDVPYPQIWNMLQDRNQSHIEDENPVSLARRYEIIKTVLAEGLYYFDSLYGDWPLCIKVASFAIQHGMNDEALRGFLVYLTEAYQDDMLAGTPLGAYVREPEQPELPFSKEPPRKGPILAYGV